MTLNSKKRITNTTHRLLRWSAVLMLLLATAVSVNAADFGERPLIPFGVSDGQTLRVVALNLAPNHPGKLTVKFLDADGNVILESALVSIASGQIVNFDLPRTSIKGETGRLQIRPVAVITDRYSIRSIHVSVEVFNDDDGKTTVLWDGPPVL